MSKIKDSIIAQQEQSMTDGMYDYEYMVYLAEENFKEKEVEKIIKLVELDKEYAEKLTDISDETGLTKVKIMRRILTDYIEDWEKNNG